MLYNLYLRFFYILNHPVLDLVKSAYADIMIYPDNRICIESTNTNFNVKDDESSDYELSYCYELVIPPSTEKQIREYMQMDLKKYFGVVARKEIRKIKCLVLSRMAGFTPKLSKVLPKSFDIEKETRKKYIYGQTVAFAVQLLNGQSQIPFVDESHFNGNISIDLPFNLTDLKALQAAFRKIGFDLTKEEKDLDVVVISDL